MSALARYSDHSNDFDNVGAIDKGNYRVRKT